MNKKVYTLTVHNTNTNPVHAIVIAGRSIYGKSKIVFNNLEEGRYKQIEGEVFKTRFARMTVKITETVASKVVIRDLTDDEKEAQNLLKSGKYDEAKIILDKINTEGNNKDNPDLYDSPDKMTEDIMKDTPDVVEEKETDKEENIEEEKEPEDTKETDLYAFDDMSKKELFKFAEENRIEVPDKIAKKDLLEIIKSIYYKKLGENSISK